MNKKQDVRCANTVKTKSGKTVECKRFLFEISEDHISTTCPNCGAKVMVQKDSFGRYYSHTLPKGDSLMECAHEKE
jgi:DNA-directed RNA polymerase subunit RPC12/RpoP